MIDEDTELVAADQTSLTANDVDAERDTLTVELVEGPKNGTLELDANGSFRYVPSENFFGADAFSYIASDGVDISEIASVRLQINAVNDAPLVTDDIYFGLVDEQIVVAAGNGVLANDSDIEGDTFSAELVTDPDSGSVTLLPDGSFVFDPAPGFTGSASFTYRAKDADPSEPATVQIGISSLEQQQSIVINEVHVHPR